MTTEFIPQLVNPRNEEFPDDVRSLVTDLARTGMEDLSHLIEDQYLQTIRLIRYGQLCMVGYVEKTVNIKEDHGG